MLRVSTGGRSLGDNLHRAIGGAVIHGVMAGLTCVVRFVCIRAMRRCVFAHFIVFGLLFIFRLAQR
jgi:hypothetical protein